jgi:hypothetical protein
MRRLLYALGALLTAVVGGTVALADPPADWPGSGWPACADAAAQYCIESATVTPAGGVETPAATLGLSATVTTLGGYVTSFNWSVAGFDGDGVSKDVRAGYVELTVRTGAFVPRYTMALARDLRVSRTTDADTGNSTVVIAGRVTQIDWITQDLDLFSACVAGTDCGDADTRADATGTGSRFIGNTQDMQVWDQDARDAFDGFYLASDAQARPTVVQFATSPAPYWYLSVLGNPHLDQDGEPVRGSFNAFVPGNYFASVGTTAKLAATVGFDVQGVDTVTGATTAIPATVTHVDGGVMLDVPDLGYSIQRINVYNRAPAASADTLPGRPTGVHATAGASTAAVGWTGPDSNGGATITAYTARAFGPGGGVAGECAATAPATSCTIAGLSAGVTYGVAVSATNAVGDGTPSTPRASVTIPAPNVQPTPTPTPSPTPTPTSSPTPTPTPTSSPTPTPTASPTPAPTLPPTVPTGDGTPDTSGGVAFTPAKRTTTLTGSGFAPNSQVTVGIYSAPATLVTAMSDAAGNVSVEVTIPEGYTGSHTLAISGIAPGGAPRVLTLPVTVAAANRSLPVTGAPVGLLVAAGLALVGAGATILRLDRRSTRGAHIR